MKIETLDDWNAVSACCCPLPACPVLITEHQHKQASTDACFITPVVVSGVLFGYHHNYTHRYEASWNTASFEGKSNWNETTHQKNFDEGTLSCGLTETTFDYGGDSGYAPGTFTYSDSYSGTPGGIFTKTRTGTLIPGSLGPGRYGNSTEVTTWSNPVDYVTELTDQAALILASLAWISGDEPSSVVFQWLGGETIEHGPAYRGVFVLSRFRWVVPNSWPGIYYKVTWDVIEEPNGWDDPSPTVFRSFFLVDQTWEWTGPGDPGDADSWKSPWTELPIPEVPGSRRIVNIRFECWKSTKLGNKPQVIGEAVSEDEL